jgi:hypothetical protein
MPAAMTFTSLQTDLTSYLERGTVLDPVVFAQLPELINFAERRISTELKVLGFVVPAVFNLQAGVAVYQKPDRWRKTVSWNVGAQTTQPVVDQLTQVFAGGGGVCAYLGTIQGGASNALVGQYFTVAGFINTANNGTFLCSSSSATIIVLSNPFSIAETNPATATQVSTVGPFLRNQIYPRSYEYLRSYWPNESATSFSTYSTYAPPKFYADYNYQNFIIAPTPDLNYPAELVYYEQPALLDNTNQTNFITQYLPNLLLYASLLECTPFLKKDDRIPVWQSMYDRFAAVYNQQSSDEIIDRSTTRHET